MFQSNDEPLVTLTLGEPSFVPSAFSDLIGAIIGLPIGSNLDPDGQEAIIDQIVDELTPTQMDIVERIAALVTLHRAATNHQTFSEWLGTADARETSARAIAVLMDQDGGWPRGARTHAEFREHITRHHVLDLEVLDRAWDQYRDAVLGQYGDSGTVRVNAQYATLIMWRSGEEQVHPKTVDGTSRYEAERHAAYYNEESRMTNRGQGEDSASGSSASIIRRAVAYGPWYAI